MDSYRTQSPRARLMTNDEKEAFETVKFSELSWSFRGNRYRIAVPWKEIKISRPTTEKQH